MAVYSDIWDGPARVYRRDSDGDPILSRKRYEVIHNTSNDASDTGEADYAQRRTDASSHYYADGDSITQSLDTGWCAGHVGSFEGNTYGISWEFTGFNSWSRSRWLSSIAWDKVAAQMARDCREFGIEPRLLSLAEIEAGSKTGFITHNLARLAWGETTHTDPGPGFPMDHLLALVREQLDGDGLMSALSEAEQRRLLAMVAELHEGRRVEPWRYKNEQAREAAEARGEVYPDMHQVVWDTHDAAVELAARPPVQLSAEQLDQLADKLAARMQPITRNDVENATEAGMRRVLGGLDGVTPDGA